MDNNSQDKRKFVKDLAKHPGWLIIKDEVGKKIQKKKDVLESCTKYDLDGHRGELKGLRWTLERVEEIIREEK